MSEQEQPMKVRIRKITGTVERVPIGQHPSEVDVPLTPGEYVVSFEIHEGWPSRTRKTTEHHWTAWVAVAPASSAVEITP